jgi:hypothetical protein
MINVRIFIALQRLYFGFYTKAIITSHTVLSSHTLQQFMVYTLALLNPPILMLYLLCLL